MSPYLAFGPLAPDGFAALARLADSDPSIGAVGSVLLSEGGCVRHAGYFLREGNPGERLIFASLRRVLARDVLAVSAAGLLVRRDALERVGGSEDGPATPGEAIDLCLRLRAAVYRVVVQPESRLIVPDGPLEPSPDELRRLSATWAGRAVPDEADRRREEGLLELAGLVETLRELRRSVGRVHALPEYDLPAPPKPNTWTGRLPWNAARRESEESLLPQYRALEAAARLMERLDG